MIENASQVHALECYEAALSLFRSRHFARANQKIHEYRRNVDYTGFKCIDNRGEKPVRATVIVVTRDRGKDLFSCLDSLKRQKELSFEIIVVDNGSTRSIQDSFQSENILLVKCPIPFTPSEARNIAAFYARAELLIFLDDDALAEAEFVKSAVQAFEKHPFLGIRGRIMPKSSSADNSLAGLYDLGNYPLPALLDIEGNMAVPKSLYHTIEGMNPLLFGAEGLDLTARLLEACPDGDVYYWPGMVIKHDYVSGDKLLAKRQRQALVNDYLKVMHPHVLKIKEQYTRLYRMCRKEEKGLYFKKFPAKLKTVCKDMGLALKSEKFIFNQAMLPLLEKHTSKTADINFKTVSKNEIKLLLNRVYDLESELEIIRRSLTFRLGQLIRDAVSSPFRQGPLLPFRLVRLIKESHDRSYYGEFSNFQGAQEHGKSMRNRTHYSRPGREEHEFKIFDEFQSYRTDRKSNLRIASILSPWMNSCLQFEGNLIPLCLDGWQEVLHKERPDFLLVQSLLEESGSWEEYCASSDQNPSGLTKLMTFCKREGIPTVFWDTEDHLHFPLFTQTASLFDRVFAADPKSVEAYGKLFKREVVHLGPAVQPALHNPFKAEEDNHAGFTILLDGWGDILEDPAAFNFLKPLFKEGLHIVESRYRFMANKLDDMPGLREHIMGCITYGRHLSALRHYRVLIIPEKSLSSPMAKSWKTLEALSCGCCVITNGKHEYSIPEGLLIRADDDTDLQKKALAQLKDESSRLRHSHLARRILYSSHTYAHRIRTICQSLGIEHDWVEFPLASVVLPTKRPNRIRSCLEKFHSQNYPNKELVIVVNTDRADMSEVQRLVDEFPDVHVFQMHQEKNIGTCLNFGVAQTKGKYWFKMDDDDLYGPNYLLDMIHLAEAADFDILGKPPAFIYLEDKDKIFLRDKAIQSQYIIGSFNSLHLCGATLGGNRDRFPGFSESHRACVDTSFVEDSKAMDRILLFGDVWNFIAFRSADKKTHTWRHDDQGIIKNSIPFCKGLMLEKVMT